MNEITIVLPVDYTDEQAFKDAAIASGNKIVQKAVEKYEPDESYIAIVSRVGFMPDGSGNGVTVYTVESSDAELVAKGKQIWLAVINDKIVTTRLAALKVTMEGMLSGIK
jgi:hypothetical protein